MVAKHRLIDRTRRYTVRCVLLSATLWSLSHAAAGQTVRIDDMLVDVGQLHNTGSATGQRWPDGIVYYAFDASVTRQQKARFEKAVARWESAIQEVAAAMGVASPVTFAAATESESNYILVENDAGSGISGQTHVGAAGPAAQFRISDWSDTFTVEHELGHTLGLIHEHQRSDRDNYIVVHLDRMGADCHRFFEVIPNAINYSSYDLQSLMHYSTTVCARNLLKPTIELRAGSSANVGQRARIRRSDAEDVFHRYAGPLLTATAHGGNLNRYTFVLSFSTRIDPASLSSAFEVVGSQTGVHHYVTYQSTVEWRTTVQVSLNQPVYVGEIITLKVLPVLSDLSGMSQRSPSAVQFEVQDRVATPIGPPTDATISSPVDFVWLAVGAQSVEIQVA
ncbi:MAG: M12 family metallopeptidase, partial [Rhodothermales bacterium]